MPELPDVEAYRRSLSATSLHRRIAGVGHLSTDMLAGVSPSTLRRSLVGASLEESRRHGKYLFARLDGERWLVLHFGMTGRLDCVDGGELPHPHTRLALELDGGCSVAFDDQRKLGEIGLADDIDEFVADHGLGPDALGINETEFRHTLDGHRGGIKATLMNQEVLAGIGNVYSDEILFQARLHPHTPVERLDRLDLGRLHRATQRVLRLAADRGADPTRVPRTWLLRHRVEGERCPRCGTAIERVRAAGRSAYLCPHCQRR